MQKNGVDIGTRLVDLIKNGEPTIELIKFINDNGFNGGNNPVGIAAAAMYVACQNLGVKRSQKKVAEAAGVSEVTVRKNAKIFNQYLSENFFQDFAVLN